MNIHNLIIYLCLIFIGSNATANRETLASNLLKSTRVGERETPNYYGPLDPKVEKLKSILRPRQFVDDTYKDNFIYQNINTEIKKLHDFWEIGVRDNLSCSDYHLNENINYIRYLFRLSIISYLTEGMSLFHKTTKKLDIKKNSCSFTWKDVFGKCSPKSKDMKTFLKRGEVQFNKEILSKKYNFLTVSERDLWLKEFKNDLKSNNDLPLVQRYRHWNHGKIKSDLGSVEKFLNQSCHEDKNIINSLCSEEDLIYGASNSELISYLIQKSNAFYLIDERGNGRQCIKKYVDVFQKKERKYDFFPDYFLSLNNYLKSNKNISSQGRLFVAGALKEFDLKGLDDFIFVAKKEEKKIEAPIIVKNNIIKEKAVEPVKRQVKTVKVKKNIIKKELPKRKSQITIALEEMKKSKKDRYSINMSEFKKDFSFSEDTLSKLRAPLREYYTRDALTDMKKFDKLGDKQTPMRILFIKYLIEEKQHHALFNIISIIGNTFYVINDIDKTKTPIKVEIVHTKSTERPWLVVIHKS